MSEREERCENCRFWDKGMDKREYKNFGGCRRLPPVMLVDATVSAYGRWPVTAFCDWCGEFQPKRLADDQDNEFLDAPIDQLKLSVRAHRVVLEAICRNLNKWKDPISVRDLVKLNVNWLLDVKNCGIKTLEEIRTKLAAHGLHLKDDDVAATTPAS